MAETAQEQAHYGGRCMHGNAVGTPGGADLMCPLCEDGATTFVPDVLYSLFVDDVRWPLTWWQSDLDDGPAAGTRILRLRTWARLRRLIRLDWMAGATFEVRPVSGGYWV